MQGEPAFGHPSQKTLVFGSNTKRHVDGQTKIAELQNQELRAVNVSPDGQGT